MGWDEDGGGAYVRVLGAAAAPETWMYFCSSQYENGNVYI